MGLRVDPGGKPTDANSQRARLEKWLSDAIGPGLHLVNSYHHQAIRHMPAGWRVAARALDGVVEAIEHPDLPVLSVQWHPEYQPTWASYLLFSRFLGFTRSVPTRLGV